MKGIKSCKVKTVLCLLVCLVAILGTRRAFSATVSIPNGLAGIVNTTVMVPVNINEAVFLSAYNLEVGYDPDVLDFVGLLPIAVSEKVLPGGAGSADDYFIYYDDPNTGEVRISVVNFYPVAKAGVLMYLKFTVLTVAMDSLLTIYIVTDPGNDLSGSQTSAGSITTSATAPAGKCQIRAVMTTVPVEVVVNLKAEGAGIIQRYPWYVGEDPNVVFIVDPGTYQIVAQSEGYATYYSSILDCNQNSTDVVINTVLKPLISQIDPNHGDSNGNEIVTINGSGFGLEMNVLFGGKEAYLLTVSSNTIICITPPGLGNVNVEVIDRYGYHDSTVYQYILKENLYLDDHHTGLKGETVQFTLSIKSAPNPVEAFGLDIVFDPNVLEPTITTDANDFIRGDLVHDFNPPNGMFAVGYIPGNNYIRIGGFTNSNMIHQGASGSIATLDFTICKPFGTTNLIITRMVDDISGWSTRSGSLYSCISEVCDGKDNDCDGEIDEGCEVKLYWDGDMDGYGDTSTEIIRIYPPYGYTDIAGDCDDDDPYIHPEAMEQCDGVDNNCDGAVDEGCLTYYLDADGDGFGDPEEIMINPYQPEGYVSNDADCDDQSLNVNPVFSEVCNYIDDNCNGQIDEGCTIYYHDSDNDGYGNPNHPIISIFQPNGCVINNKDCNDNDPNTYLGATEICDNKDNNCDGIIPLDEVDIDGDGQMVCEGDCDDKDATVYPSAPGTYKGKDNNCNGIIDEDEKRRPIYPTYSPILPSGSQYKQLWTLSFLPLYLDLQGQIWFDYQYALYQQQLIKAISSRNQFWFSISQPYWRQPYLKWYFVSY